MSENSPHQPAPIDDTPTLRELHHLFLRFLPNLGGGRDQESLRLTYAQFAEWWSGLDPATQQMCESGFRKGYAALVEEGERQVATVIAKYEALD